MNHSKTKCIISMVLTLLVLLAGCEKSETNNESEIGHIFEEKEISFETSRQILSVQKVKEDLFVCSYLDPQDHSYHIAYTDAKFTSLDPILNDAGNLIHASELNNLEDPYGQFNIGVRLVYDVDLSGNIYILQYESVNNDGALNPFGKKRIFVYTKDGVLTKQISVDDSKQAASMPPGKLIVQNNRLIIIAETGIQVVNLEGAIVDELAVPSDKTVNFMSKEEQVLPNGRIIDADIINENELIVVQDKPDHKYILAYDLTNKKTLWSEKLKDNFIPVNVQFEREQNQIFIFSRDKVLSYHTDGTYKGEIIDFNQYTAVDHLGSNFNGDETISPGYLFFEQDKLMYVYMIGSPPESQIKKIYSYRTLLGDERGERIAELEKEKASKTNVTLFVPFIEPALEQKVAQYMEINPQIHISLSYYREEPEEFNFEDYMQYVNLQLFSNKNHWDVMAIQLLPYQDYVRKGYFANFDEIASEQWIQDQKRIFPNIIDAARVDGKLMLLPARIMMHVNLADKKAAEDLQPFQYTWNDLLASSNKAKEADPTVKKWSFFGSSSYEFPMVYEEIMQAFQTDLLAVQSDSDKQKQLLGQFLDTLKAVSIPDDHAQPPHDQALFNQMPFIPPYFANYIDLIGSEKTMLPNPASPQSGKHAYTLQEGYAINKDSKVKEEALKFMFFLVEQAYPDNIIFKKSFDAMNEQLGTSDQRKEAIQQLQAIVENLNVLRDLDYRITDSIFNTAQQYINGLTDKETAIRTIQEKLWLYENE